MRDADVAMYRAKAIGKGRCEFFDAAARTELVRYVALGRELEDALSRGELDVYYQPIVSVADGQVLAVEALARWVNERWGRVAPDEFIPLAEKNGSIVRLGRYVLEAAARQTAEWRDRHPGSLPLGVFVNVSLRELAEEDFAASFTETLTRHGLGHGDVSLELTERIFIEADNTTLARNLAELRESGTRIVLDDFGTGYSSLGALERFPLAAIKIDRSFLDALRQPEADSPLARAAISLGKSLGLIVIAEGVEDDTQLTNIRRLGCDAAQGFLLERPLPADALSALIAPPTDQRKSAGQTADQSSPRGGKARARSPARREAAAPSRAGRASDAPIPVDDPERLASLHSYGILDTGPDPEFDDLARLAAEICRCPMAFVNLVDRGPRVLQSGRREQPPRVAAGRLVLRPRDRRSAAARHPRRARRRSLRREPERDRRPGGALLRRSAVDHPPRSRDRNALRQGHRAAEADPQTARRSRDARPSGDATSRTPPPEEREPRQCRQLPRRLSGALQPDHTTRPAVRGAQFRSPDSRSSRADHACQPDRLPRARLHRRRAPRARRHTHCSITPTQMGRPSGAKTAHSSTPRGPA